MRNPSKRKTFVIYVDPYDQTSGGVLALYLLCDRLNAQGETAVLWPSKRMLNPWPTGWRSLKVLAREWKQGLFGTPIESGPFNLRIAKRSDLKTGIVVYPEIVAGNPLRANHIVRWFLHRPGYHTGKTEYGEGELFFFYQDAFNDPSINPHPENRLTLTWLNPVYKQTNFGPREGACYLLRKGKNRAAEFDFEDQLCIDNLSDEEKAIAFNRFRYLHSLDTYSMYAVFAAMCGCVPVIEPLPGVSREEWFPNPVDRYGQAYGWEDEGWAANTQVLLLEKLANDQTKEDGMLTRFVRTTQDYFAGRKKGQ